jgi:hypothetical protein
MLKTFSVVVLALAMSVGVAQARHVAVTPKPSRWRMTAQ